MNVSLTPELERLVNEKVAGGHYQTASEVIREGLRLLDERDRVQNMKIEKLRQELAVGAEQIRQGRTKPLDPEEMKERVRRSLAEPQEAKECMKRYELSEHADQDLFEIAKHIGQDSQTAADRFVDRIHEKCQMLADHPGLGKRDELLRGSRSIHVGDYLIFYFPADFGIQIVRIVHGYRDLKTLFEEDM